jgi:hypothetical protein
MRGIVLSLAAVSGLGVALVGGRAIAAGRAGAAQPTTATALASPAAAAAGPVWYGGTLAPIVVVATAPPESSRHATQCDRAGG